MARLPGSENFNPFSTELPARTPGSLGKNDAGDPDLLALPGDTPGPLGINDGAAKLALGQAFSTTVRAGWVHADLHGLQPIAQPLSSLCWLTCYRMLYIWKGLTIPIRMEGKRDLAGLITTRLAQTGSPAG